MNKYLKMAATATLFLTAAGCGRKPDDFKFTIDQFADVKVIRYQVPGWDELTFNQKAYAYHLAEAAKFGWDIYWDQNCCHNLQLRHALADILNDYNGDRECDDFIKFTEYAKRVFFSSGIQGR